MSITRLIILHAYTITRLVNYTIPGDPYVTRLHIIIYTIPCLHNYTLSKLHDSWAPGTRVDGHILTNNVGATWGWGPIWRQTVEHRVLIGILKGILTGILIGILKGIFIGILIGYYTITRRLVSYTISRAPIWGKRVGTLGQ